MTTTNHTRRALENRRPETRKLDSCVCYNNSSDSFTQHARNALPLLCPDGAAGVAARDEALQPRGHWASDTTREATRRDPGAVDGRMVNFRAPQRSESSRTVSHAYRPRTHTDIYEGFDIYQTQRKRGVTGLPEDFCVDAAAAMSRLSPAPASPLNARDVWPTAPAVGCRHPIQG